LLRSLNSKNYLIKEPRFKLGRLFKGGSPLMIQEDLKLVVFTLSIGEIINEYGVSITQVHEITRSSEIVHLPGLPDFIEGIMNLRGNVIPIINLKKRFGLGLSGRTDNSRIIVIQMGEKQYGIVVDNVLEIISISKEHLESIPSIVGRISYNYILGICKVGERMIIALDVNKILSANETAELVTA